MHDAIIVYKQNWKLSRNLWRIIGICSWRRISLSIKGNSVTLLDECKEVGNQELDRSSAPLDTEGVIFIGNQMDASANSPFLVSSLPISPSWSVPSPPSSWSVPPPLLSYSL